MRRSRPITFLAGTAAIPLVALAVTACGGGGGATAATRPAASSPASGATTAGTVRAANSSLGSILVDPQGRTLYLFKADSGTKSACTGACAAAWPPLRATGKPTAGSGAKTSLLGTAPRSDGAAQVTYNGHPLYLYVGDKKAGDDTGQGVTAFGAPWYVVSPGGQQITSRSTSSQSSGSFGY